MFPYLALGVALSALALLAFRWFLSADPKILAMFIKWLLIAVFVTAAGYFVLTGRLAWAFAVLPALIPMLLRLRTAAMAAKNFARMAKGAASGGTAGGGAAGGQKSDVQTRFLSMSLDHDSGIISGQVLDGVFKGRLLDAMTLEELRHLLDECRAKDQPSAQVLEAYLDRAHGDWRNRAGRDRPIDEGSNAISRDEALRILGLEQGATPQQIKEAHRRLINGLHPDHGGSTYLAAKINQAKDALLG